MIRVDLSTVAPGARLAKPIYNDRGAIWLKAGTELTERYLSILGSRGVGAVFLEEDATADVVGREAISDQVRGEATSAVGDLVAELAPGIDEARAAGSQGLQSWLQSMAGRHCLRDAVAPAKVGNAAMRLVGDVLNASYTSAIISPKGRDGYVLAHAVDVATVAVERA